MTWLLIFGFVAIVLSACWEAWREARRGERGHWTDEHGRTW